MLIKEKYCKDTIKHDKVEGLFSFDPNAVYKLFQLLEFLSIDEIAILLNYYYKGKSHLKHKILVENLTMWKIPNGYSDQLDFLISFNKIEIKTLLKSISLLKTMNKVENMPFNVKTVSIPQNSVMGQIYTKLYDKYWREDWFQPTVANIMEIVDTTKVVARTKFKIGLNILCYFKRLEQVDKTSYSILRKEGKV